MGWRGTGAAVALMMALHVPAAAPAYQLNPLKDRNRGGELPRLGKAIDTVHEDITYAALACADSFAGLEPLDAQPVCNPRITRRTASDAGNISNALIVGLWWNDDPRQFLFANNIPAAAIQWADAQHVARQVRRSQGRYWNGRMRRMMYRSHFSDLQFVHGMANHDLEPSEHTRQRILRWLSFAYAVATGEIRGQAKLAQLDYPIPEAFADGRGLTVKGLFKPRSQMAELPLAQLALGSLLHTVQDSYAASHAQREFTPSVRCPNGRITQFYSFLQQDTDRHRAEDSRSALQRSSSMRFTDLQNPVEVSARLIILARRNADWDSVVEPYLRSTVFCLEQGAAVAGPGMFR